MSATNRGAVRRPNDAYSTPPYSIISLLEQLDCGRFRALSLGEPCVGTNMIPQTVADYTGYNQLWETCEIQQGQDYLKATLCVDVIITNPPYSLAQEFLDKSLCEAPFVAYLLRLNFLGSQKRRAWWQGRLPTHLYALSRRPRFTGKGTDATDYGWFVWDRLLPRLCCSGPGIYVI